MSQPVALHSGAVYRAGLAGVPTPPSDTRPSLLKDVRIPASPRRFCPVPESAWPPFIRMLLPRSRLGRRGPRASGAGPKAPVLRALHCAPVRFRGRGGSCPSSLLGSCSSASPGHAGAGSAPCASPVRPPRTRPRNPAPLTAPRTPSPATPGTPEFSVHRTIPTPSSPRVLRRSLVEAGFLRPCDRSPPSPRRRALDVSLSRPYCPMSCDRRSKTVPRIKTAIRREGRRRPESPAVTWGASGPLK